ncbi:MAG: trypsin-like serine protease [Clostridiales bacterium]|nr:trypsin-like serine protease [Clostridiales bacterium]
MYNMYNDNERNGGTDIPNGVPASDNPDDRYSAPDNKQPDEFRQQMPSDTETQSEDTNAIPYYEPWQQPVAAETKAAGYEQYSPGINSGAYNTYQRYQAPQPQPEKKKKGAAGRFVRAACLVLVCLIASAGATYGVMQHTLKNFVADNQSVFSGDYSQQDSMASPTGALPDGAGNSTAATSPNTPVVMQPSGAEMSAEEIYAMAVNQVVGVNSERKTNVFGAPTSGAVSGSGFIISSDGYIVTNYHVVSYAAEQGFSLTVMSRDGKSYPAQIIGSEPDNDLAVIKIDATGLDAVTIGSNDNMKVGEEVYAIGNPLGELDYTMTSGIVSALDRIIRVDESTSINMFQFDAAVNQGNSGGPVYNSRGEVIGIVAAKYASTGIEGLGFAIPIDDARDIVEQLMTTGHVSGKPYMGISVRTVTQRDAEYYNLVVGAYVVTVERGSSADKAGLKIGDIITRIGDMDVTSSDTLKLAIRGFKAGDTTTVVVKREGQDLSMEITFDEAGVTATASEGAPQQPVFP